MDAFFRDCAIWGLPIFAKEPVHDAMSTMNISLPETLKSFVDAQVSQRGYGTSSEYVRELIRKDQDRLSLRNLLLAGAASAPTAPASTRPSSTPGTTRRRQGSRS